MFWLIVLGVVVVLAVIVWWSSGRARGRTDLGAVDSRRKHVEGRASDPR